MREGRIRIGVVGETNLNNNFGGEGEQLQFQRFPRVSLPRYIRLLDVKDIHSLDEDIPEGAEFLGTIFQFKKRR